MQFGDLMLRQCRYGWMLFSGAYIGKCFELYGEYSESEVKAMAAFVSPGDVVIDVGANIGDLTLPLARMAGGHGRVYAMEMVAESFNVLCSNLALNHVTNVQPINAMVARHETATPPDLLYGPAADKKVVAIGCIGTSRRWSIWKIIFSINEIITGNRTA